MKRAGDIFGAVLLVAFASFMLSFGHVSWWFGLAMLAWNFTPLLFLRYVSAKRPATPSAATIALLASALYVGVASCLYLEAYADKGPMVGFSYLYVPIAGWLIALIGGGIMVWIEVWRALRTR
jgi:hypothetical protein